MKYFLRALRDASKSWPLLLAAFLCSAGVAGLWGANIAALFPIIEVTLNGESLQDWNQERIETAESKLANHKQEIDQLRTRLAGGGRTEAEQQTIQREIDTLTLEDKGQGSNPLFSSSTPAMARKLYPKRSFPDRSFCGYPDRHQHLPKALPAPYEHNACKFCGNGDIERPQS